MIPVPSNVNIWLATGATDMRKGMNSLALQVQQSFGRDPHAGDLFVFRGAAGDKLKIIWHDGIGMSLYANYLASYCISSNQMRGSCGDGGLGCRCAVDEPVPSAAMLGRWV
jgi:transposase